MKVPYREDVANHSGPESCAGYREVQGEALTGENAGQVLSCEILSSGAPTLLSEAEGHIGEGASRESSASPTQSETLSMRGSFLNGTWEIPFSPAGGAAGRSGKAICRKSDVYGNGKSDDCTVPMKLLNNGEEPAEAVEGRRSTKGNVGQSAAVRTQSRAAASFGLAGVREAARKSRKERFTALLHHVTIDLLRDSFYALKRQAASGVDGVTWQQYEEGLEDRLVALHRAVQVGSYRAQPSRRVYIAKADGTKRPLGVAAIEDKTVQQAVVTVLNAIYEADFLGFSYGFRPGRSQHDALDALWMGLMTRKVNWVLDADIRSFYDTIDHTWMMRFIEHRVADKRLLRLIRKWLRAGVMEEGVWSESTVGTPQGAVVSCLLANIYLHYSFDLWAHQWRQRKARGEVLVIRYADDIVLGFQHQSEARRFLEALKVRMQKFGLALHPDKTRLLEFGRFAATDRQRRGERKPATFDFLGFTHACGQGRETGRFVVRRLTMATRLRAKLRAIKEALLRNLHRHPGEVGRWLQRVMQGFFNYHAIPGNMRRLAAFRTRAVRTWLRVLRRRSQRHRMPWARFARLATRWVPYARLVHPSPSVRFYAKYPR
jgi:RNA-directed DNA polymerase